MEKKLVIIIFTLLSWGIKAQTPVTPGGTTTNRLYTKKIVGVDTTAQYTYTGIIQIDSAIMFLSDSSIISSAPYTIAQADSAIAANTAGISDTSSLQAVLDKSNTSTTGFLVSGQSVIGTGSTNSTAILTLSSPTKGFLPPRMTTAQRIAISNPAEGLIVYDTNLKATFIYNGSNWTIQ